MANLSLWECSRHYGSISRTKRAKWPGGRGARSRDDIERLLFCERNGKIHVPRFQRHQKRLYPRVSGGIVVDTGGEVGSLCFGVSGFKVSRRF